MNGPLRTIGELEQTLLSRKKTDRTGLPGLEKGRKEKEVIAADAIIIRTIMETFGCQAYWSVIEGCAKEY